MPVSRLFTNKSLLDLLPFHETNLIEFTLGRVEAGRSLVEGVLRVFLKLLADDVDTLLSSETLVFLFDLR